jgi:predicted lipoprotein with Yx(FWY)xxD motif
MERTSISHPRLVRRVAALALAFAVLISACGGGANTRDKTATTAPGQETNARTGTPTVQSSPTVRIAPAETALKDEDGNAVTQYVTDAGGLTLYYYKPDVPNGGKSSVPAAIAPNWPPLTIAGAAMVKPTGLIGELGVITTADNKQQVTYGGKPLYYFKGDTESGQTNGEGLDGNWFVVAP